MLHFQEFTAITAHTEGFFLVKILNKAEAATNNCSPD